MRKSTLAGLEGRLYGIALGPRLIYTQGGPRRNVRGEIIDAGGNPIKGLYGAGEEPGSIWGFLYQSGGNLGECLGLGRMVGPTSRRNRRDVMKQFSPPIVTSVPKIGLERSVYAG